MPNIFANSLKLSLLSGLFVFIDLPCFNRCFYLLCFIARNNWVMFQFGLIKIQFIKKQPFFFCNFSIASLKFIHIPFCNKKFFRLSQKHPNYTLQNFQHLEKHLNYCPEALKSKCNIQNSNHKHSKAIEICSTRLYFSVFRWRYRSVFYQNPTL